MARDALPKELAKTISAFATMAIKEINAKYPLVLPTAHNKTAFETTRNPTASVIYLKTYQETTAR